MNIPQPLQRNAGSPPLYGETGQGLMVDQERAEVLSREAVRLPSWHLTPRQVGDVELLLSGAFLPLTGFPNKSEPGFSREHRDLKVKRIGFAAGEITKNSGVAVCAPIASYAVIVAKCAN